MNKNNQLIKRDIYLNKLISFKDSELVKVITGIRRCGKSSLLKLMVNYLKENGVDDNQIIEMNFESFQYRNMNVDEFYAFIKERIISSKKMYLFFDELQHIDCWVDAINAFRVDFDCDIYITGSNAYLLSSEYSTYLSGRYVEIKMLPLSFKEFLDFFEFKIKESSLDTSVKYVYSNDGEIHSLKEIFNIYMMYGGMPGIKDVGLNYEKIMIFLDSIYSTIIVKDILEKEKRRGMQRITDTFLLRGIVLYLCDCIGSNISISNIGNVLKNEGLLNDNKRKGMPSNHTVGAYITSLLESYFFYEIKRFDIKGKDYLRTLGKYYIVDIGLRNYLLGYKDENRGYTIENIVYLELLRKGYDVAIGKIDDNEVDFIATNSKDKIYIQVTESMMNSDVREKELKPLKKIKDNYEKIILSLDDMPSSSYEGIKSLNVIDFLLSDEW